MLAGTRGRIKMPTVMLAVALYAPAPWWSGRIFGEAILITIAAVVIGYIIARMWPKDQNPSLFGSLAAMALVGGLAAAGMPAAILAIILVLCIGTLLACVGIMRERRSKGAALRASRQGHGPWTR
jgi:amino acid transporter